MLIISIPLITYIENTIHMLPAINPPTDSLYKLVAIFGLTIFLFYVVMLSDTYHDSTEVHIKIENLMFKMRRETGQNFNCVKHEKHRITLRPYQEINQELLNLEKAINCEALTTQKKNEYRSEMNEYHIKIDAYRSKIIFYWILVFSGVFLMFWGFFRWNTKEQKLRNAILIVELEEKQLKLEKLRNSSKTD